MYQEPKSYIAVTNLLGNLLVTGREAIEGLHVGDDPDQHAHFPVLLLCSIHEMAHGIYTLMRSRSAPSVAIVFRSLLEAYIDLLNLFRSPDYLDHMGYRHFMTQKKILAQAKKFDSLGPILNSPEYRENEAFADQMLAEIAKRGVDDFVGVPKRLSWIGRESELWPIYWILSQAVHGSLKHLELSHVVEQNNGTTEVTLFHPKLIEECVAHCHLASRLYVVSLETVLKLVENDTSVTAELGQTIKDFENEYGSKNGYI